MGQLQKKQAIENSKLSLTLAQKSNYFHLCITPPTDGPHIPSDIVCILDSSGSMDSEATVKNSEGIKESQGYSLLDILKHAVKTIIYNLNENDRFSLVKFSNYGYELYPLNYMNQTEKEQANQALESITANGATNLWDGLLKGSEILKKSQQQNRQKVIILLTDGEPNQNPPQGIIKAFQDYLQKDPSFKYTLHTLALGKQMDSALLTDLAINGQGQFSFIPCAGFMGTIFVNTLSNILCTCASNATVILEPKQGVKIVDVIGFNYKQNQIELGDIKYGQTQDLIIEFIAEKPMENPTDLLTAKLYYSDYENTEISYTLAQNAQPVPMFDYHLCRLTLLSQINKALAITKSNINRLSETTQLIQSVTDLINQNIQQQEQQLDEIDLDEQDNHPLAQSLERLKNILIDITGEITLAFQKNYSFNQWGQHYIPSLLMCHQKQTCNNFKDPGIKLYGGELFKKIKQQTEDTFLSLPPPKSEKQQQQQQKYQQQQQQQKQQQQQQVNVQLQQNYQPPPQQDFSVYYDAGGGCFSSWSKIMLQNGNYVPINQLHQGDIIKTRDKFNQETTTKIKTIIKIQQEPQKPTLLVHINENLYLTPKHPLFTTIWIKPTQLNQPQYYNIDYLYNIVLEKHHQVYCGGYWCVTLGHEIQDQQAYHHYFATEKVIKDLEKFKEWNSGEIMIQNSWFKRNSEGSICAIQQ